MYRREIWEACGVLSLARPPRTWEAHGILGIHPWPARHESCRLMESKDSIPRQSAMNIGG